MRDFPRSAIGVLVVTLAVTLSSGALQRLGALTPKNLFPPEVINVAFTAHQLAALIFLPALLLGFVSLTRPLDGNGRRKLPAAGLLILGVASAAAVGLMHLGYRLVWDVLMAGSLVMVADAESPQPRRLSRLALGVFVAAALALSLSESDLVVFAGVVGKLVAAIVLIASSRGAIRSSRAGAWPRRYYALALVTFLQAVLMRALLHIITVEHFHDTLFSVGTAHLEFFTPAFALLGLLCSRWPGALEPRAAMTGFVLLAIGCHVFAWSMLRLGTQGMPRRYLSYLPQFEPLQILCTCGAMMLMLGVVAAILGLRGRRGET